MKLFSDILNKSTKLENKNSIVFMDQHIYNKIKIIKCHEYKKKNNKKKLISDKIKKNEIKN